MKLSEQSCTKVEAGTPPISKREAESLLVQIPSWRLGGREIEHEFRFKDFREAMLFVNRIADIADKQDHHPDIFVSYNKVKLVFSTHKIGGLSMNDFIMAARVDMLDKEQLGGKAA